MTLHAFDRALAFTLRWEGGFVNDPADPGGATNKGITQKVFDAYRREAKQPLQSVRFIQDTDVRLIYFDRYWMAGKCDQLPALAGLAHFDACVNHGIGLAARLLQKAAGVAADGRIGPVTLAAVERADPVALGLAYVSERRALYTDLVRRKPQMGKFLRGWLNRMDALAQEFTTQSPPKEVRT